MKINLSERIAEIKSNGYDLNTGEIMRESVQLFFKNLLMNSTGMLLFFVLFSSGAMFINSQYNFFGLMLEYQGRVNEAMESKNIEKLMQYSMEFSNNPEVFRSIMFFVLFLCILYPIQAGFIYCAFKRDTENKTSFKDLIEGFQGVKFVKLFALIVSYVLVFNLSGTLYFIPMFYLSPLYLLIGCFIIINNSSISEAFKYSFIITNKNYVTLLGLSILVFLIGKFLGLTLYFISIFSIPYSSIMIYCIYKKIIFSK